MDNKSTIRIILLGSERTGKTSLIKKYIHSTFNEEFQPSFSGTESKTLTIDNKRYTLELVPATKTGQEVLCRSGDAFVLLYAINDRASLHSLRQLHQQVVTAKGSLARTPVFLVGAKADLESERHVDSEEARQLAVQLKCQKWFEVSAKTHDSEFQDMFEKLVREWLRMQSQLEPFAPVDGASPVAMRPPMTPISTASFREPTSPMEDSPRRNSNVFERLKFGSLRRKSSLQSLTRKKSGSFGENIAFGRAGERSTSAGNILTMASMQHTSTVSSPFRLDIDTSAWRDTVKWPTEIIPEEEAMAK